MVYKKLSTTAKRETVLFKDTHTTSKLKLLQFDDRRIKLISAGLVYVFSAAIYAHKSSEQNNNLRMGH